MRVIVGVTAASGAIYARQVTELLVKDPTVEEVAMIYSARAEEVISYEGESVPSSDKIVRYGVDDMFAPPASGSSNYEAMVIVPCTTGTMARIASGVCDSLLTRAADVMLKERRKVIIVLRETPLSLIHLRNMTTLTEAGAIIMPASPSLYMHPSTIEELALSVSSRAVDMVGCRGDVARWEGKNLL